MIRGVLIGHEDCIARLKELLPTVEEDLVKDMGRTCLKLVRKIKRDKLTGQVLKNRTGTLRRSINHRVEVSPGSITGSVGTNVEYAAAHEYGFTGVVTVKEHMRLIKKAFGRSINPKETTVRTHTRDMRLPERSFLRSALREMEAEIKEDIRTSLENAVQKTGFRK